MPYPAFRLAPLTLAVMLALSTHVGGNLAYAQTAAPTIRIELPAQSLGTALNELARQANLQLMVAPDLVAGKSAPAVSGRLTVRQALDRLLEGNGLAADVNGSEVIVRRAESISAQTTLPVVTVTAATSSLTTEGSNSYGARGASIGKSEQRLKDVPQSVSVMTRQRMDDQNLLSINDVMENTTGVTLSEVADGGRNFYSRGFSIKNIQYDGVPLSRGFYAVGNSFSASTAYLDRVEVVRGATGILEGAGEPGGSVNLVRKRGLHERSLTVEARAGSWNRYGALLDVGGPLNEDKSLRGRAVIDYDSADSYIDVVKSRNQNAYVALDYDLAPDTTIGLGVAYSQIRSTPFFGGLPRYQDGRSLNLPRSTFLGADWNSWNKDDTQVFADLEHRFNNQWKLKIAATYANEKSTTNILDATGAVDPSTGLGPERTAWRYDKNANHAGIDANLNGKFDAAGMAHELTIGASWSRLTSRDVIAYAFNHGAPQQLDVFNPDHGISMPDSYPDSNRLSRYDPHVQKGIYGQVRSEVTDRLTVLLGGRFSWFESNFTTQATTWSSVSKAEQKAEFTPFAGAVYALNPQWSAYASYAEIFDPQTAVTFNGQVLDPVIGSNYEAGIKGELADGALNASFAVYRINQTNRAVSDYANGQVCNGNYCSRAAGKVRSQGFEAELSGELLSGWQMAAGYTYNSNRYINDPQMQGKVFSEETPRHMLRLWSNYQLPGDFNRWNVGGGVNYQGKLYNSISQVHRPGYSVWNMRIGYKLTKNWMAALNINNLFDKKYYEYPGYLENRNNYGAPRNALLTLRGRF